MLAVDYYEQPTTAYVDRSFLYGLTMQGNSLTLEVNDFAASCHRFGLDSPFPCVVRRDRIVEVRGATQAQAVKASLGGIPVASFRPEEKIDPGSVLGSLNLNASAFAKMFEKNKSDQEQPGKAQIHAAHTDGNSGVYIDTASTLFAQHYSIIRELLGYCEKFKEELASRNDLEEVWRNLDLLMSILDAGCHFLRFPVVTQS